MVKEKRRKTNSADNDGEVDVYKKVVDYEEKEALTRSAEDDANLYFDTCKSIRQILADIFDLKVQNNSEARLKISEKCTQACLLVAALKKLNRLDKFRSVHARESLSIEKQKVDSTNLQYQNLLYEAGHLMSEYNKCKQFKSKDEDIELISLEEFLKEAPESVTKPFQVTELTDALKHDRHVARLEYELTQRKQLAELCKKLEDEKKQLAKDIIQKKNKLDLLAPRLATVLEATKPLQEQLGLPIGKLYAEHKAARLLPEPLYLLYVYADAFKQVYISDIGLEILGDQDDAQQWKEQQNTFRNSNNDESEQETEQEVEEIAEVKKRRRRKSSIIDRNEEKKKRLLSPHPLAVQIIVKSKEGVALKMTFSYRYQLNIVTVVSSSEYSDNFSAFTAKEILNGNNLLGELFEEDKGTNSPNSGNTYQLKKVGVDSYSSLVTELGNAYQWAQRICGMDFLEQEHEKKFSNTLSQASVEIVLKTIIKRLNSHVALATQLQQLESNIIPSISNHVDFPKMSVSSLTKFVSSSWSNFCKVPSSALFIENEVVGQSDLFYTAIISRNNAIMQAHIVVKNNYPIQLPIFVLLVKYKGELHSGNSDDVRDMERAVNVGWCHGSSCAEWLLAAQIKCLCMYFDVYLETSDPAAFQQNVVFFRNVSGRNRGRPFKFHKIGTGIFTQT
ncbi:THO complex subunit 5 homolog B [Agrilus planipennis]|uniref:THO complex subunit 5 homolog B n=1 Tax=Agrilus planipennis TaxID=224129 RepID=A0A1W4XIP5_AGRPL|nr:THO complex subunit 5 homolog B [Agrilus planipennis]